MEAFVTPEAYPNTCPGVTSLSGFIFSNLVRTVIAAECAFANISNSYPRSYGDAFKDREEFDFIVVGAGASGSVVAGRLAENLSWRILVLEAGGLPPLKTEIPALARNFYQTQLDWNFPAIPNGKSCLEYENGRCYVPAGKVLGGGSTFNGFNYIRGNPEDYNDWERHGNTGWSYRDVLPYFKKLENYGVDNMYHSTKGPVPINNFSYDARVQPLKTSILRGFAELGYPLNNDFAAVSQVGFGENYGTLYPDGTRASTAKTYLNPKKSQENLKIITNALAEKIVIHDKKATGVVFIRNGKRFTAIAKKEVIVSCGTVNTPKLLMLSGIGCKKDLEPHKIELLHSLAGVGKNLQEHPGYTGLEVHMNGQNGKGKRLTTEQLSDDLYMYLFGNTGPLGGIGVSNVLGFIDSVSGSNVADLHFNFLFRPREGPFLKNIDGFDENLKEIRRVVENSDIFIPRPGVMKPKSRGYVKLKSANPLDEPLVYLNLLDSEEDVETLIRGIEIIEYFLKTKSFSYIQHSSSFAPAPECDKYTKDRKQFLRCHVHHYTSSLYHMSGTSKMGPKSDPYAVVDSKLKVHGIKGLRVADASIMPSVIRGNTNIPCIMIGEKAADMVKVDWDSRATLHDIVCSNAHTPTPCPNVHHRNTPDSDHP